MTPAGAQTNLSALRFMMRALAYRNYRLFFGGQIISLVGTWVSSVATSWLVYRLATADDPRSAALMLGLVGFAGQIPIFLLAPLTGVLVDRWSRRRILIRTQFVSMVQSFVLAFLALSKLITIPQILALSALQGAVNALDMPARQSLVVQLVKGPDLANAIALSSSMVHAARLLGPAVAGYLIYQFGEGICFMIDGFSYLAVLAALVLMRVEGPSEKAAPQRVFAALKEGFSYAFGFAPIRTLLSVVAITSLTAMSQSVLMPVFADQVLGGQERTLGLLLGASGLGALAGSLYLASRGTVLGLGRIMAGACFAQGIGLILFCSSRSVPVSLLLLTVVGFSMVVQMASANTILQTIVDEDKRGRVMSLFTMAFMGMSPFGSLFAGALASVLGAPWALSLAGIVCALTGILFAIRLPRLRHLVRPIYAEKGILPPLADAMQSAAVVSGPPVK